ncbi:MAG TPA: hypothetical protein ENJ95_19070 [Bacteroidetes bacterium]|nr:hypothetical protein [Bacteroidota bacterium]
MRPVLFVLGIVLIAMLAVIWIAGIIALFFGQPMADFVSPGSAVTTFLGTFNILLVLGIPLLMLVMFIMRVFLRSNFRPKWQFGLWAFWLLNVVSLALIGVSTAKDFSHGSNVSIGSDMGYVGPDTIYIEMEESPFDDALLRFGDNLLLSGDQLISRNIDLHFMKSESGRFEVSQRNLSRGRSLSEARQLANDIVFDYRLEGNKLILPAYFTIEKGHKWRNQWVALDLKIPEGKYVRRNWEARSRTATVYKDKEYSFPWYHSDQIWQMGENGMIAPEYISETKKEFTFNNFSKIRVEGDIRLKIRQGNRFHIGLARGADYSDEIEITQSGDRLDIFTDADPLDIIRLDITMPRLEEIWAITSDEIDIRNFKMDKLHIVNEGRAEIRVHADINNLQIELTGDNELELRGEGNFLNAGLSDSAELHAEHFTVKKAKVELVNQCLAKISATDTLWQKVVDSDLIARRGAVIIEDVSGK